MAPERPALRTHIEALPVDAELNGAPEQVFLLRDRFKLSDRQVVLPLGGLAAVSLLDGTRTLDEVAAAMTERYGAAPPRPQLAALVEALDAALLLEGPALKACVQAFATADRRPPACIGSYPGEPDALRAFLSEQYERPGGPGGPPATPAPARDPIRGIVSPHIDLHRGGHAYAWAWRAVAEACPARLFVVFGTSHAGTAPVDRPLAGPPPRYALTRKDFETPLGPVPTDREVLDRLLAAYDGPDDLLAGEFHHRNEHSIEFQTVYLAHLFGGRRDVRILPVLCDGLQGVEGDPRDDPRFAAFHRALRTALAPLPAEEVAFVAGIDLAHVGAQFDAPAVAEEALAEVARQDRETLRLAVEERCPRAVHQDIAQGGDPRNICGHGPLVSLLVALDGEPLAGETLLYDRWYDGQSAVSFAAAVYRRAGGTR